MAKPLESSKSILGSLVIISNIIGGLGNQMFQYAAGRARSLKLDVPLKLDTRDFSGYQLHQGFELYRLFNCCAEIVTNADLTKTLGWQKSKLAQRILRKPQLKQFRYKNYVVEPHFNYWRDISQLKGNIYLDGYWQSEQYFIEFADKIRVDFTFKLPFSEKNAEIAKQISQANAVSLHVRRGDYVTNRKNVFLGVCSLEYYQKAISQIKAKLDSPVFFVFSDDIDWAKNNLNLDKSSVFISHNKNVESYNDMRLMSLCKHNIIANSTFSWWGAWLNSNPNKIVITPLQWFANGQDAADLVPSTWVRA
jgi:Glycosyl transferase family 11